MSLKDGRVLYSRDGDKPFTPASNMKVYTTAVALDLLGPDYRWRTSVYALKQPDANGVINGDLTLYGRGAPDLVSKPKGDAPSLAKLADQLYQSGCVKYAAMSLVTRAIFAANCSEWVGNGMIFNGTSALNPVLYPSMKTVSK